MLSGWGEGVVRSWHEAGWLDLPVRVGRRIAPLVGAQDDEVVVSDSVSVNLFKLVVAALRLRPQRKLLLTEIDNFPSDLYILDSAARLLGAMVRRVSPAEIAAAIDDQTAVVVLTHVNYRSAAVADMAGIARAAHHHGALTIFDLSHTVGALSCDLNGAVADFAVGCGYKYLNGGPGAPAFTFAARRHHVEMDQPLQGWLGHAAPFEFEPVYRHGPNTSRFLCGTPPILSLVALEAALDLFDGLDMAAVEEKSRSLTGLFVDLFGEHLAAHGFDLRSEQGPRRRGSHVAVSHNACEALMTALLAQGFLGDFRAPDVLRFGFAPLYTRHVDVYDLVQALLTVTSEPSRPAREIRGATAPVSVATRIEAVKATMS